MLLLSSIIFVLMCKMEASRAKFAIRTWKPLGTVFAQDRHKGKAAYALNGHNTKRNRKSFISYFKQRCTCEINKITN